MKIQTLTVFFFSIFCSISLLADSFLGNRIDELDVTYSYYQDKWVMGLSDGSCWELMPLAEKRKQSWGEWWNKKDPKQWELSEEYFFDPLNWKGSYSIEVFEANDSLSFDFSHILVNMNTGEKVFAKYIPFGSFFIPKVEHALQIIKSAVTANSTLLHTYSFLDDSIVLSDQSIWRLYLSAENKQSWSQWWNCIEVDQPDQEFVSKLEEWKPSDQIEIYSTQFDDQELQEKYKVSKPLYELFLIENKTRGKFAYAGSIAFQDFLESFELYAKKRADQAYSEGYSFGYTTGYNAGYIAGYSAGYTQGKNEFNIKIY